MTQWLVKAKISYFEMERLFDDSRTAVNVAKEILQFHSTDRDDEISVSVTAVFGDDKEVEDDF